MKYTKTYNNIVLIFTIIGLTSFILRSVFSVDIALYSAYLFGGILFFVMALNPIPKLLQLYIFCAILGAIFLIINNGLDAGKTYLPLILSSSGIALGISRTIKTNFKFHIYFSAFLFFGLCFYFFVSFAIDGNLSSVTAGSRNHVSTNLILISIYYVIVRRWNGLDITPLYPILILTLSSMAIGISGIISSVIIFLGYFVTRGIRVILFVGFTILALSLTLDWVSIAIWLDDDLLRKIYYKLSSPDIRVDIIEGYIERLDAIKFITGVPINELEWTYQGLGEEWIRSNNLHNSYLLLHSKVGINFFAIMIGLSLILLKLLRKDFLVFTLLFAILLRASTDTIILAHGFHEWALILILLYAVEKPKRLSVAK